MVVYNVSIKIMNDFADEWVHWMKSEHIPAVMESNCFESYHFYYLHDQDESEGKTYVVQYFAKTMQDYELYRDTYAKPLQSDTAKKFTNKFVAFRTLMSKL